MTVTDIGGSHVGSLRTLEACARLLDDARDTALPALRRLGRAAAFCRRLDECFESAESGSAAISTRAHELVDEHGRLVQEDILPILEAQGVAILGWDDLTHRDQARVGLLFEKRVQPVLTPLTLDATHPFPYLPSLCLNVAVSLRDPDSPYPRFARIEVPAHLPRFLVLAKGALLPVEQIISVHLPQVFRGMNVLSAACFRVTRGAADLEVDGRSYAPPTRLEVDASMSSGLRRLLTNELALAERAVYTVPNSVIMGEALRQLGELEQPAPHDVHGDHPRRGAA